MEEHILIPAGFEFIIDGKDIDGEKVVHIQSIGKGATVVVTNAKLHIHGDVGEEAKVAVKSVAGNGKVFYPPAKDGSVTIGGSYFYSPHDTNYISIGGIVIEGKTTEGVWIDSGVKSKPESFNLIIEGDVGCKAKLNNDNGNIRVKGYVFDHAELSSKNGNILAKYAGKNTILKTKNGNVTVESGHRTRDKAQEDARRAREQAQGNRRQALEAARRARDKAQEDVRRARDKVQEDARRAREQAQGNRRQVLEAAHRARDKAQEDARRAREQARQAREAARKEKGKSHSPNVGKYSLYIDNVLRKAELDARGRQAQEAARKEKDKSPSPNRYLEQEEDFVDSRTGSQKAEERRVLEMYSQNQSRAVPKKGEKDFVDTRTGSQKAEERRLLEMYSQNKSRVAPENTEAQGILEMRLRQQQRLRGLGDAMKDNDNNNNAKVDEQAKGKPAIPQECETNYGSRKVKAVVPGVVQQYTKKTQKYLDGINAREKTIKEEFDDLGIDDYPDSIECIITEEVPNKPVYLDGRLYDLDILVAFKPDADGMRIDPFSRDEFELSEIQPARQILDQIHELLDKAKALGPPVDGPDLPFASPTG